MRLSASRIKRYLTCPRQFRYHYLDDIPSVPTAALLFGTAMHETLRWLQESRLENGELPSIDQAMEVFCAVWNELLRTRDPLFKSGTSEQSCAAQARQMLAVHLHVSRSAPEPLLLEFPFELPVGEHTLVGILDRVDEGETGLVVVDYKSGARKPSARDLETDLQLTVYAYAVQQMLGLPVERVVFHWLRDGVDLISTRGKDDFAWLADEIMPYVAQGVEAEDFAPKPGYYCRFCDFRELCQAEGPDENVDLDEGGASWPTPSN